MQDDMPRKTGAVAFMGRTRLLLPNWIRAALAANDRLKLHLSALQVSADHASHPEREPLDVATGSNASPPDVLFLRNLVTTASRFDATLVIPALPALAKRLGEDLAQMARPVIETHHDLLAERVRDWQAWFAQARGDRLSDDQLAKLVGIEPGSFHGLVMDLHRTLNEMSAALATEDIDGAHAWQIAQEDRPLIVAFMRGVNRTARLKFDHPGLSTTATHDGERLLLENDIGTNDAHLLIVEISGTHVVVRYSDLHAARFQFFQSMLRPNGPTWETVESHTEGNLNQARAFKFGVARFDCADSAGVATVLEAIGSRIVFLIDWNRARKRLLNFVGEDEASDVLDQAARADIGHMGWLSCGGEQLVFGAMRALGDGNFRIGDRLDSVLGAANAKCFMLDALRLSSQALQRGQPRTLVADETRLLLSRYVRRRSNEFEMLEDHAAYCHALAQAVSDAFEHHLSGVSVDSRAKQGLLALAARAKAWEHQADQLVNGVRENAERQARWQPVAHLIEVSDDVADSLEESAFLMGLMAEYRCGDWPDDVREAISQLARTVLAATQEYVKALAIARDIAAADDPGDSDAFIAANWKVLDSEQQCDALLRRARRAIFAKQREPSALMLDNELAGMLELASDHLLAAGYRLRGIVFGQSGDHR